MKIQNKVKQREDFETNIDDDEEEMMGPSFSLFQQDEPRQRKPNDIYNKVKDISSDEDEVSDTDDTILPISHEVDLE